MAVVVAVVSVFGALAVVAPTAGAADCPDVRFVGVRGSGEAQDEHHGMGRQTEDVFVRLSAVPGIGDVQGVGLGYPAVDVPTGFTHWQARGQGQPGEPGASVSAYALSVESGVSSLTAEVEASVAECPNTPVVLGGHSQGAEVIDSTLLHNNPAFEQVAGVVLFGDPTFVSDRPYARGTFEPRNGLLSEIGVVPDPAYWGQIASYCRKNDMVCQAGTHPGFADLLDLFRGEHSNYIDGDTEQAAAFLVEQLRNDSR